MREEQRKRDMRGWERERERERDRDRDRAKETERHRETETERRRETEADKPDMMMWKKIAVLCRVETSLHSMLVV